MAKKKKSVALKEDKEVSFEQAMNQLEETVSVLENGQLGLTESLESYEMGVASLKRCYELLEKAEQKIELLSGVDADGNPTTSTFVDEGGEGNLEAKAGARSRRRSRKISDDHGAEDEGNMDLSGGLF
jgi:exodeoxyribonuclease VII small subunit